MPAEPSLYALFAASAGRFPDHIALEAGPAGLTYRELSERVDMIAAALRNGGVHGGQAVALLTHRHADTYAAYLAILQVGATVVPLNPAAPRERVAAVLADVRSTHVVTARSAPGFARPGISVLVTSEFPASSGRPAKATAVGPDDIAYIVFTSGSTGRPKGVPISHRNVYAYATAAVERMDVRPDSRLTQAFELTFDGSIFDLFAAWTAGAALVVPQSRELLVPVTYVNRRRITHWFSVPSVVSIARRMGALQAGAMPQLRYTQFGGEQLTLDQARAWHTAAPNSVIDNVYGPTETTCTCASYRLPRDPGDWPETSNGTVPIGDVYRHLEGLVIDGDGHPATDGELCVRGPQRFSGYLDPRDDENRFFSFDGDRAVARVGGRISDDDWYRTGDRVRRENGVPVHLGRLDRQVQLRGFRLELGEVEAALRRHPRVLEAVAVLDDDDDPAILRVVLTGQRIPDREVKDHLNEYLPDYMIPGSIVWTEALPLGTNAKVDMRAVRSMARGGNPAELAG
ncbi:amino acid adenylation domain-containing protein [Streptomyces puniciscabiei]|uniref:amino acid adenylation domain-containing protein n=1 Tax=Streptomyces puniciscabiei TaxID=164348 RepID=UPI003320CA93